jgi:hypothetical protein
MYKKCIQLLESYNEYILKKIQARKAIFHTKRKEPESWRKYCL